MAHLFTQYLIEADPDWASEQSVQSSKHWQVRIVQQFLVQASQHNKMVILGVQ
jgi:hypothetical protein